jgi:hypothetical protein
MFNAPPDTVEEDASLPAGTIAATILDADDHPVARAAVTIGILHTSVAKGESRGRVVREADDTGFIRLDGQETGTGVAYRVSVSRDDATFGANPFQLPAARGMRVKLHVYEVTRDVKEALVVMQAMVFTEVKDDRIQLQSALQIFNFGRLAWVPEETYVELPKDFTAFKTNEEMGDRGVDAVPGRGARLRGTYGPGRANVEWQWQLPYDGERDVKFELSLPPNVAVARVMAQAGPQMTLDVPGFDTPKPQFDNDGQRVLITEKQARRDDPALRRIQVTIGNLPTQGPARFVATGLAAIGVLSGIGFAFVLREQKQRRPRKELDKLERAQLLSEFEELERMHQSGEVGPKTYERARRELIDALARTFKKAKASKGDD